MIQTTIKARNRDYTTLPWVAFRWIVLLPACMLVAIITYFIESIINGLFGGLVSGLVGFIGFGAAGYAAVITAELIAPNAKRAMGAVVTLDLALLSAFVIGNVLTVGSERQSTTPIWYTVALLIVLVMGAGFGIFNDAVPADEQVAFRVSPTVRWVLFIPIAAAASFAIAIGLVYIGIAYPSVQGLIDIETRFLSAINSDGSSVYRRSSPATYFDRKRLPSSHV